MLARLLAPLATRFTNDEYYVIGRKWVLRQELKHLGGFLSRVYRHEVG
jgi:hypothetical protein